MKKFFTVSVSYVSIFLLKAKWRKQARLQILRDAWRLRLTSMSSAELVDKSTEDNVESHKHTADTPNSSLAENSDLTENEINYTKQDNPLNKSEQMNVTKFNEKEKHKMNFDEITNFSTSSTYVMSEKFAMVNGCIDFSSNNNVSGRKNIDNY